MPPTSPASSMAVLSIQSDGLTFRRRSLIFAINDVAPVIGRRSLRPSATSAASIPRSPKIICAISRSGDCCASRAARATGASTRSPTCSTIKQVAAELERGTPLRVILRALLAERQGQLAARLRRRPRRGRHAARESRQPRGAQTPIRSAAAPSPRTRIGSSVSPCTDPQAALAAKYFIEGSRLDDGDERNDGGGGGRLPARRW